MGGVIAGHPLVDGVASGAALVAHEPLSFWGGFDSRTGEIIDRAHPLSGCVAAGRVLALPFSRGSSTTTAVLLEALRAGTAPAAILVSGRDTFFALASIVAAELYGRSIPVLAIEPADLAQLRSGDLLRIAAGGLIEVLAALNPAKSAHSAQIQQRLNRVPLSAPGQGPDLSQ